MSGYTVFSRFYDALTANIDYNARALFFDKLLRRFAAQKPELVLDLACGTGSLSLELHGLGYEVIGVDASEEMLSVAASKSCGIISENRPIFLCQEMDKLDLYGTVDAAICALDSVNHIENAEALLKAFKRVSLFLNPGGIFIFDVNTLYKHSDVLSDNAFIYDLPEVFCAWQNAYDESDGHVDVALDFFEKNGASYKRSSESFSEQYYPDETLQNLLEQSGFCHLSTLEDDSIDSGGEAQRLVYVAKKR